MNRIFKSRFKLKPTNKWYYLETIQKTTALAKAYVVSVLKDLGKEVHLITSCTYYLPSDSTDRRVHLATLCTEVLSSDECATTFYASLVTCENCKELANGKDTDLDALHEYLIRGDITTHLDNLT